MTFAYAATAITAWRVEFVQLAMESVALISQPWGFQHPAKKGGAQSIRARPKTGSGSESRGDEIESITVGHSLGATGAYSSRKILAKPGLSYCFHGARSRTRTGTALSHRGILSPLCLPIPPSGPGRDRTSQFLAQIVWPENAKASRGRGLRQLN